ncbi:hypothetical protein Syun_030255 [Stephania yunnanensis]|uniref:Formin-like protein n=1 Tax=Stephania yunnanensis TaxID=152371 RepID=A0AAP0E756_9MAGN
MKKSQSIAILLRALNMSTEEVCQALMEGNAGTLGTDLLGTLLRMAPTKDEEFKLKECKHDSLCNLGPAEQFLKAVLDIPFAFRRLDAMLYIANFDSEVEYLRMSFEILKIACQELRNSRMFQKFLQAMVNIRDRVNVADEAGTFELETLLKLINAEGPDGKTILLNFVIKEITRDEGIQDDDVELGKLKWNVIDDINMELINVKKAAEMDSFALINDVSELVCGIKNVGEVVRLNEATGSKESNQRFSESMNKFLKKAEGHITRIQAHQSAAFFLVEEVTAYFHVNSAKKLADPFIIFKVVSDFLSILNQACKEVDKNNEQATFNTDNINTKTAV